jgi:hypothetical protein
VGRGLRDIGRGLQESPESRVIADIARDRKNKRFHAARPYSIAVIADIARDRKSKTAVALSLPLLPTDFSSRVKKALTGPFWVS